ncbi:MAG: hypothetical protein K2H18_06785 [Muribaculaceae bacterium]|nr:hypothetical protein [Muribaculaceae bacterium]
MYEADTNYKKIIFRNGNSWGNGQTGDLAVIDGAVYDGTSTHIADIVDGSYVPTEVTPIDNTALYLLSSDRKWTASDDCKFTEADGVYTLTASIYRGSFFKIATPDWGTSFGGPSTGNNDEPSTLQSVEAGKEYTIESGSDTKDLFVPEDLVNVTITFNKETLALTISANGEGTLPELNWYCAYDITGGTWVFDNMMEKQEEGTYKLFIDCTNTAGTTNYFALFQGTSNNDWDDGIRYQPMSDSDIEVNTDESFSMKQGTESTWKLGNGKWTVVVDPRDVYNMTISFDLGDSTGEANVLIDRSEDTEWAGTYESLALTEVEGEEGKYTWTGTLEQGDKLKFNIHGVDYYYDPSIGTIQGDDVDFDGNITIDYPLEEVAEGDNSFVTFDYSTEVTYTIDVTNKTITADLTGVPRVTVTITNAEGQSTIHKVERQGSTRIYISHAIECNPGDCVDFRLLNTRYECDFNSPVTRAAQVFNLVEANDTDQAPALNITEPTSITFTVDAENKTVTLEDGVETGVAEIAADNAEAVYFNLQGVQIEKPENGLFIEVRGNKAAKVMVK